MSSAGYIPVAPAPRRYNFFHALFLSFFSRELYADVAWRWRGIGFLYLLFLIAVSVLPLCVRLQLQLLEFARNEGPALIRQMPRFILKDGRMSTDPPGRHEIKDPDSGRLILVIDTESEMKMDPQADVTITATHFIFWRESRREVRAHEWSRFADRTVDQATLQRWLDQGKFLAPLVFFFLVLILFYIYRILQALFYSLFGLLFASARKIKLEYPAMLRLVAVAVTPAVLLDVANDFIPGNIPLWWLICFLISMAYLSFGIHAAASQASPRDPAAAPAPLAP